MSKKHQMKKMAKLIPMQTLTFIAGLAHDVLRNRDVNRSVRTLSARRGSTIPSRRTISVSAEAPRQTA